MSLADSIDEGELVEAIVAWCSVASPTFDRAGVNRMMDLASEETRRLGLAVSRRAGTTYGDTVVARLPDAHGATTGGILVLGHLDTVQSLESVGAVLAVSHEGDRIYGPGIYDMKGGMRAALHGLDVLNRMGRRPTLPVTYMFIPDEEIGSPSTRDLIEAEGRTQKYVLLPEPAHDGKVVTGRHAFQRFHVTTRGRPAHAGFNNREGKNAVRAMAELIVEIERLSDFDRGETYSIGVVKGGLFVNVIPTLCRAEALCVAPDEASFDRVRAQMLAFAGTRDGGITVEVEPGPVRPLFRANAGTMDLFARAQAIAAEVGIDLRHDQFGAGSDGNFTGALGIPTLDGLGVDGAGLHTPGEYMLRTTLVQRCAILTGLLERLT